MKTTKVVNLATGQELYYTLPPEEAVKNAYIQYTLKNFNTWQYEDIEVPMVYGTNVVSCGDFTALLSNELQENIQAIN